MLVQLTTNSAVHRESDHYVLAKRKMQGILTQEQEDDDDQNCVVALSETFVAPNAVNDSSLAVLR